jgi:RNA polymerase primary sigma factor
MSGGAPSFIIRRIAGGPSRSSCPTHSVDPMVELRVVRAAQRGDPAARTELLDAVAPLIRALSVRYRPQSARRGEVLEAGTVGMLWALERYDAEQGTPFWAYASWWVRHAIQRVE